MFSGVYLKGTCERGATVTPAGISFTSPWGIQAHVTWH